MKKFFLSLAVVMSVSMFSCGGNGAEGNKADSATTDSTKVETTDSTTTDSTKVETADSAKTTTDSVKTTTDSVK